LAAAVAICLASAPPALANGYEHVGEFGSVAEPTFGNPLVLAVDQANGDLLVVDSQDLTISRWHADGTPDDFSALSSNVIDGKSGADETPAPHGLSFRNRGVAETQVAVDASCALHEPPLTGAACTSFDPADGDIYVTQRERELVYVFGSDGSYLTTLTEFKEGANATGAAKAFGLVRGVAVDSTGTVYVSDYTNNEVHKYVPSGHAPTTGDNVANYDSSQAGTLVAGEMANAGYVFVNKYGGNPNALRKIHANGVEEGVEECAVSSGNYNVAVNPSDGNLSAIGESEVREYDGSCTGEVLRSFTLPTSPEGVAVDGESGLVYVSREGYGKIEVWEPVLVPVPVTTGAGSVEAEGATLEGEVNANGLPLTSCYFAYGKTASYGQRVPCAEYEEGGVWHPLASPGELEGNTAVKVRSAVTLESGTRYHFQLDAENFHNQQGQPSEGGDKTLMTLGAAIAEEGATQITTTSAVLGARINPNGEPTVYKVQYIDLARYLANPPLARFAGAAEAPAAEVVVPPQVIGSGQVTSGSKVIRTVNATAGAFGAEQTIAGAGIPGGTKIVAVLGPGELELSAAATASTKEAALTATGPQPVSVRIGGLSPLTAYHFRFVARNAVVAQGSDQVFATFAVPTATLPDGRAYEMVSPDRKSGEVIPPEPEGVLGGSCELCMPGISQRTMPMQAAPGGSEMLYAGQPFSEGLASGVNDYVAGRGDLNWGWQSLSRPTMTPGLWEGFSEDLTRGVFSQVEPPLSPAAPTRGGKGFQDLYMWDVGSAALQPLITTEPPNRGPGPGPSAFKVRFAAANSGSSATGAFTHVALEANDALTSEVPGIAPAAPEIGAAADDLYEWSGGRLRLLNVAPGNTVSLGGSVIGSGRLLEIGNGTEAPNSGTAMSADGQVIFFGSEETGHVYARIGGGKTFVVQGPATCKASEPSLARACFLTASADGSTVLLSNGTVDGRNDAAEAYEPVLDLTEGQGGFQGILGAAENLSRVYFVDTAVLPAAAGQTDSVGETPQAGHFNLYYRAGGVVRFIGALLEADNGANGVIYGTWHASPSDRLAQVTPDGRYLAFMSQASLTGYDNSAAGGGRCPRGTIASCFEVFEYAAETGTLSCASCNPSGRRPVGSSNLTLLRPRISSAPGTPPFRQPGNLSRAGEGRLFFESRDVLSSEDVNGGIQDVYEWEPDGVGSCAMAGGCVDLISSGHSGNDSMFVDSSASGDDAFFITRQKLLPRDEDDQLDLYDARVGGGFEEEAAAAGCTGESCRPPISTPPSQAGSGSASWSGPGNPAPAKQQPKQQQKKKQKHKKRSKHKKKKHGRRAARHGREGGK
jgi:hypothetical protein